MNWLATFGQWWLGYWWVYVLIGLVFACLVKLALRMLNEIFYGDDDGEVISLSNQTWITGLSGVLWPILAAYLALVIVGGVVIAGGGYIGLWRA